MSEALEASGVTVDFGSTPVLSDVDIAIHAREFTGLVGPSGSGKTTLLRVLAGLQEPSEGEVTRPGSVAVLAQHPRLVTNPRWTLRRIIAEPAAISGSRCDVAAIAAEVGLDVGLLDRSPAQVSDGQLQRACIGRILVQAPDFLLCDEPIAMLDPMSARAVVDLLARLVEEGMGALLVSHNVALVRNRCSRIVDLGESAIAGR